MCDHFRFFTIGTIYVLSHHMELLSTDSIISFESYSQGFAEVAFCAIMANELIKGCGTRLMNHLKQHAHDMEGVTHHLTWADSNVVDYFLEQVSLLLSLHMQLCI